MVGFSLKYFLIIVTITLTFSQFVACGSQLYQVSMRDDHDLEKVPKAATTPGSPSFGIHAPNGWNKLPIEYKIGAHLSTEQYNYLVAAMKTWETAIGKKLFNYTGRHNIDGDSFKDLYSSLEDRINGNYLDANWSKTSKPSEVLATTIWDNNPNNGGRIETADIRFNTEYYLIGDSLRLRASEAQEVVDMQSLALHELGHFLGLSHVGSEHDSLSIMNPQLFVGEGLTSRRLSKGDIERIQKIYGCKDQACDIDAIYEQLELNIVEGLDARGSQNL